MNDLYSEIKKDEEALGGPNDDPLGLKRHIDSLGGGEGSLYVEAEIAKRQWEREREEKRFCFGIAHYYKNMQDKNE